MIMELLTLIILWSLYCHFFVKPYETQKKKVLKKKRKKGLARRFLGAMLDSKKSDYEKLCDEGAKHYGW